MSNAVSIEYAFAHLLGLGIGTRGLVNDADVFRVGDPKSLAQVLLNAAAALDKRTKDAGFQLEQNENGSPGARIEVALSEVRQEAERLKLLKKEEGETYQWRVIGALVSVIAAMLETSEKR